MSSIQWDIRQRLIAIQQEQTVQGHKIDTLTSSQSSQGQKIDSLISSVGEISKDVDDILALLKQIAATLIGEDLAIKFTPKEKGAKMKKFQMGPKSGSKPKAVMPGVKWSTLSAGIAFQLVDATGAPIGTVDPTAVTTTLVAVDASGNPSTLVTITPGTDSLHYTISKAAGITGNVTLNATLAYTAGSPGPFSAVLPVEIDTPAAADLTLVISGN